MTDLLQITDTIAVPRTELVYRASRSGGAGGQHVNTSSTRIELLWDFETSAALDEGQKERVRTRSFCPSSRAADVSKSHRSSMRVDEVFTCWPPAPPERDARYTSSVRGTAIVSV